MVALKPWIFQRIMNFTFIVYMTAVLVALSSVNVTALRDVRVQFPPAIRKGESARLQCLYDMEGDILYSVKWYKGRREFYRYTPKENPAMKTFEVNGTIVSNSGSNQSHVTLLSVEPWTSGKYTCEVSADAPSFHTEVATKDLEVVEVPEHRPIISGIHSHYYIGSSLRANCTSRNSKPAANLTWTINNKPANPLNVRHYRPILDHKTELETSLSTIQFSINEQHFIRGKLKIRCTSHILGLYAEKTEKIILLDRPKYTKSPTNSINVLQKFPYDEYNSHNGEYDRTDSYLTQDSQSFNAGAAFIHSSSYAIYFMLILPLRMLFSHIIICIT